LSQAVYDKLIAVLDVFIDEFGGRMKLRGIKTALLIQQASLEGRGISISEVRQATGGPLESIRRHFSKQVQLGTLRTLPDPDDDRVVRYQMADNERHQRAARRMAGRLASIHPVPADVLPEPQPFGGGTYGTLIEVLQAFARAMDDGLRIRGFKFAIVIQQATVTGRGMTASEIATQSGAPMETVRRYIQSYMEIGNLRAIEDPDDHRKTRVLYRDPDMVDTVLESIWADLEQVDWSQLNLS
jgi:hypothetical protein